MPKRRSSGNLASVASGEVSSNGITRDNEDLEMGQRVTNRLSSSVTNSFSALNNLISRRSSRSAGESLESIDEAHETLEQIDIYNEEQRRNLINEEDDGFFYTDLEDEEFQRALEEARNNELPYEYENVLNGSQVTFGIELEFVEGDSDSIARELYELGICSSPRMEGYHSRSVPGKWKLERDGSVTMGRQGGELVSPVLKDTPETWETLKTICDIARRHGATINHKCGGHIHIGIEPLDTARQRWKRFFRTIGGFEDVMYRLAGGSLGRIRSNHSTYARSFAERARATAVSRFRLNDRSDINRLSQRASEHSRYYGINLTNIYNSRKPNTVEFRYFNGSLDPSIIQSNLKVANGIAMAAQKARTRNTRTEPTSETMKKRGKLLKEHPMTGNDRNNDSAVKKFVDIVFSRKKDKDSILGLYTRNSWA